MSPAQEKTYKDMRDVSEYISEIAKLFFLVTVQTLIASAKPDINPSWNGWLEISTLDKNPRIFEHSLDIYIDALEQAIYEKGELGHMGTALRQAKVWTENSAVWPMALT